MSTTGVGSQRRAEVREWRRRGLSARAIARLYGMSEFTVTKWIKDIPWEEGLHPLRVVYDPDDRCWYLSMYQYARGGMEHTDPEVGIDWWVLRWMKFATREVAGAYLEKHGEYAPTAKDGLCSTAA